VNRIVWVLLVLSLGVPVFSSPRFEVGGLWHDGSFAPFVCFANEVSAVGLMRNGTGYGDGRSIYLAWVEVREEDWAFMLGTRINLIVDDMIDTRHHLALKDTEVWQLWGWWIGWEKDEKFARGGQIFTWHGEGWAIWPLVELGLPIR